MSELTSLIEQEISTKLLAVYGEFAKITDQAGKSSAQLAELATHLDDLEAKGAEGDASLVDVRGLIVGLSNRIDLENAQIITLDAQYKELAVYVQKYDALTAEMTQLGIRIGELVGQIDEQGTQLTLLVSRLMGYIDSNDQRWTDVSRQSQVTTEGFNQRIEDLVATWGNQQAEILDIRTVRQSDSESFASEIRTLTTQLGLNSARITNEATARTTATSAMAELIDILEAHVDGANASIQDVRRVVAESGANANALAEEIHALQVNVGANTASIEQEAQVRADALGSMAQTIQILTATGGTLDNRINAAITSEQAVRVDDISAMAAQVDTLSVTANRPRTYMQPTAPTNPRLGDQWIDSAHQNAKKYWNGTAWIDCENLQLAANTAAIITEQTVRANALEALSQRVTTLAASNLGVQTYMQSTAPANPRVGDLWINTSDGNSWWNWSGTAWIPADNTDIATALAAVTDEAQARIAQDNTLATLIQGVTATANGVSADGFIRMVAKANPTDGAVAEFEIQIATSANGVSYPVGLSMQSMPNGTRRVKINATQFMISDGTTAGTISPFTVANAQLIANNLKVPSGNVTGLGALATLDGVTTSQVSGLGTLATRNSVTASEVSGLGTLATLNNVAAGSVTGLGAFATLARLNRLNMATYIETAAITDAYIDTLNVSKLVSGTIATALINIGSTNLQLSGANENLTVKDTGGVTRVELGRLSTGGYGIIIRDGSGNTVLGSGGQIPYSQLSGTPTIPAAQQQITASNISTWMASNAISGTYIANGSIFAAHIYDGQITNAKIGTAAVTSAKISDASVETLKIAGNAVTVPVSNRSWPNSWGTGTYQWFWNLWISNTSSVWMTIYGIVTGWVTYNATRRLTGWKIIKGNGSGYSDFVNYGQTLSEIPFPTMSFSDTIAPGESVYFSPVWIGDNTTQLNYVSMIIWGAKR